MGAVALAQSARLELALLDPQVGPGGCPNAAVSALAFSCFVIRAQRPNVKVTRPTVVIVTDDSSGSFRVLARLVLSFTGFPAASALTGAGS